MRKLRSESVQLGMNYCTAQQRLKKMLLFNMMVAVEMDVCIRCHKKLTVEDFSLDHKEHWLHVDVNLFWDLSNIGFSHNKCNSISKRKVEYNLTLEMRAHLNKIRTDYRVGAPEGTYWCCGHQAHLPQENFGKDKSQANGHHPYCKKCRSERKY